MDERWLSHKLSEGFDIHHMDGDHENNDPSNLVLIYHPDHMMVHSRSRHVFSRLRFLDGREEKQAELLRIGEEVYSQRLATYDHFWRIWETITGETVSKEDRTSCAQKARNAAEFYARENDLAWPLPKEHDPEEERRKESERMRRLSLGGMAYRLREAGLIWSKVQDCIVCPDYGFEGERSASYAYTLARAYAHSMEMPWPPLAEASPR